MSENKAAGENLNGMCCWTADKGYHAWSKYGAIEMFGSGGHRATEVMLIAAAACLGFLLVEYAKERTLPVTNIHVSCNGKIAQRPERLERITTNVVVEGLISDAERKKMLTVCERACKVMNTLKNQPEIETVLMTPAGEVIT